MSTEPQNTRKSVWFKWLFGLVFTLVNTGICILVTHDINPWHFLVFFILFAFSSIVIFFDKLESTLKFDFSKISDTSLQTLFFYTFIIILLSSVIALFIPKSKSIIVDNLPYVASSFAILVVGLVFHRDLKHKKNVIDKEKDITNQIIELQKIKDDINELNTHLIKYNPLYSTELTFKDAINKMQSLTAKGVANNFSFNALNDFAKYGFYKIDASFGEYTERLFELVSQSSNSVIGSFTFRPKNLYSSLNNQHNQDNITSQYNNAIKEKGYKSKIRIVILSIEEIKGILKDSLYSLKKSKNHKSDKIPEIEWFNNVIANDFKVYWIEKIDYKTLINRLNSEVIRKITLLPSEAIADFAIFDTQIFISWRRDLEKPEDIKKSGTLLINWYDEINAFYQFFSEGNLVKASNNIFCEFDSLTKKIAESNGEIADLLRQIEDAIKQGKKWNSNYCGN